MKAVLILALVAVCNCAGLLPALMQGSQWLGSVLDAADAGQQAYFARHPSMTEQDQIRTALRRARLAVAALDAALAAGDARDAEDARTAALAAYDALYRLLDETGVLSGKAPPGGAETDAPLPEPLPLPRPEDI